MYDWLADAVGESSHLVTASRRLARVLQVEFGKKQIAAGLIAWRTPLILSWQDWLEGIVASADNPQNLPTRINTHQGRLLWERCLRREISDPLLNMALLARQSAESYVRLKEWRVPLDECAKAASGKDKHLFARAAASYESILARENWVDQAGLADLALQMIHGSRITLPERITIAGFDRVVPQVAALLDALGSAGCRVDTKITAEKPGSGFLHRYENTAAELRAAGGWARQQLDSAPHLRIAIVVSNLERDAPRYARLVKEGLLPGWQVAPTAGANAVNVSYGRSLASYPAIEIALIALRWIHEELSSTDVGLMLRTPMLGAPETDGRSRLELKLRQLPDRAWSPALFRAAFEAKTENDDAGDWLQRLDAVNQLTTQLPGRLAPSAWAAFFDEVLTRLNWPGVKSPDSLEFQLINRWRELLNEFAHIEVVSSSLSMSEALVRLSIMAGETVFQPETGDAAVQLLGPLEAAGMQFDRLWIAGLSASQWPPQGRPLALVSRELQRTRGMPDADPLDTFQYADRVISRLVGSAPYFVCSYPRLDGDAEQSVTGLISDLGLEESLGPDDPHWYAMGLLKSRLVLQVDHDRVPAVAREELVLGGAATIQRYFQEPFSAFAFGRLGIRLLYAISKGLAPNVRGSLVHDALYRLYADLPSSEDISAWDEGELDARISDALRASFRAHERHADPVLKRLLELEKSRVANLLRGVISIDTERGAFHIDSVENSVDVVLKGVRFRFRHDRVDRLADGRIVILDYKTGQPKRLLDRKGEPNDMQLVAYTCAVHMPVAGIGLMNIDSRGINIDAAGDAFTQDSNWSSTLACWQAEVESAAEMIGKGDVRINSLQTVAMSRPLGLLSRFRELARDT